MKAMPKSSKKRLLALTVNGRPTKVKVSPTWTLLRVLREELHLTGTKKGCEQGDCGLCTVIMDGKTVNACLVLALQAEGKEIETIEGLGTAEQLHPLQQRINGRHIRAHPPHGKGQMQVFPGAELLIEGQVLRD